MIKLLISATVLLAALAACGGEPADATTPSVDTAPTANAGQPATSSGQAAEKLTLTYFNVDG
jgi:ABC-type glycerol-3-phosphate transport system substrate-binding protein